MGKYRFSNVPPFLSLDAKEPRKDIFQYKSLVQIFLAKPCSDGERPSLRSALRDKAGAGRGERKGGTRCGAVASLLEAGGTSPRLDRDRKRALGFETGSESGARAEAACQPLGQTQAGREKTPTVSDTRTDKMTYVDVEVQKIGEQTKSDIGQ